MQLVHRFLKEHSPTNKKPMAGYEVAAGVTQHWIAPRLFNYFSTRYDEDSALHSNQNFRVFYFTGVRAKKEGKTEL